MTCKIHLLKIMINNHNKESPYFSSKNSIHDFVAIHNSKKKFMYQIN